jgi:hypothetical protein
MRRMDTLDYWTPADALAFRCSVQAVGTLKPAATDAPLGNPELREDVAEARRYAPRAFRALVRIMEAGDTRAALEAARELLSRAYGPALAPVPTPPAAQPASDPAPPEPEWLTPERLAYQHQPGQCLPRQLLTPEALPSQCLPRQPLTHEPLPRQTSHDAKS